MLKTLAVLTTAACMVVAAGTSALAQNVPMNNGNAQAQKSMSDLDRADKLFLKALAPSNEADIQVSQLAVQKSADPQVKHLAAQILKGDQTIQSTVSNMAAKDGVSLPRALDTPDVHLKIALKTDSRTPKIFDQAYVEAMLIKFLDTVTMFQLEAAQTKNQSVLMFTQSQLPSLEKTLDQIESVSQKLPPVTTAMLNPR
jgi:putative membrane protein